MPDENKLQALRDADFKVQPTCSTCVCFKRGYRAAWGHCSAIGHEHAKHGERPKTGVPVNGWCPHYELSFEDLEDHVQSYIEFYEEQEPQHEG
jgi:hypothetical protein